MIVQIHALPALLRARKHFMHDPDVLQLALLLALPLHRCTVPRAMRVLM
jgi:hypothetical protein